MGRIRIVLDSYGVRGSAIQAPRYFRYTN